MPGVRDPRDQHDMVLVVSAILMVAGCGGRTDLQAKSRPAEAHGGDGNSAGSGGSGGASHTGTGGTSGTGGAPGGFGGSRDAGIGPGPDLAADRISPADVRTGDGRDFAADVPREVAVEDRPILVPDGAVDFRSDATSGDGADTHAAADLPAVRGPGLWLVAGRLGGCGNGDGIGAAARLCYPVAVALDGLGSLFVVDNAYSSIRKVDLDTSAIATVAVSAGIPNTTSDGGADFPILYAYSLAGDGAGNLYLANRSNHTIGKIDPATGIVTTLAGDSGVAGSRDGIGADALFCSPYDLASDGAGNLFVADTMNHTIRKIVLATGEVTTLAGSAGLQGGVDDVGSVARFRQPTTIAADRMGAVFVAEKDSYAIRRIDVATGAVTTLVGIRDASGSADGVGANARFRGLAGLSADGAGNLFAADAVDHTIRKIVVATRVVTTLAGSPGEAGHADGVGPGAHFNQPQKMTNDSAGNLLVADTYNHVLRKVDTETGTVTTIAGLPPGLGSADGLSADARFSGPVGIASDTTGNLYVADHNNYTIRRIERLTGAVTTLAGTANKFGGSDGLGAAATFEYPWGIATDGLATVYVADPWLDAIRRIDVATSEVTTLTGAATVPDSADAGKVGVLFGQPVAVAGDASGTLFVADGQTILKVDAATGVASSFAGRTSVVGLCDGIGTNAYFRGIGGLALDGMGNLFVSDQGNNVICRVQIATRAVTAFAGTPGEHGNADGIGRSAVFGKPGMMACDRAGNLFVVDEDNHTIRKIVVATGAVTTMVGIPHGTGVALGPLPARLNTPAGVAVGLEGELYITDLEENAVLVARF